jgi:MmyB-like transcription regulator ligand binding domain
MIVRLARALDVPLRERNGLLLAAGYAPLYATGTLDGPELDRVQTALAALLERHEPFPAVVLDRAWNVLRANGGAERLFTALCAPDPPPEPANVLELMIAPGPVRERVLNWAPVASALIERARREAVGGVLDAETRSRIERLLSAPGVSAALADAAAEPLQLPVLDVRFALAGGELSFFSVVSSIGTPIDVTAQELRVEAFFPADEDTQTAWR